MEKFLITRTDRLGDVVLTIAMLPILEKHFPDPRLSMRVGSYAGGLSMDSSCVDDVLIYDGSKPLDLNFLYRSLPKVTSTSVTSVVRFRSLREARK